MGGKRGNQENKGHKGEERDKDPSFMDGKKRQMDQMDDKALK